MKFCNQCQRWWPDGKFCPECGTSLTPAPPSAPPPAGSPHAQDRNGKGTASLVLGILSVAFCGGGVLAIIATVLGREGMKLADQGLASNRGVAKAGFVLGIVGLGISALMLLILGLAWLDDPSSF